ncbi:hypothetical protein AB0C12_21895 [Actinoplanes sp. NPDC048967]|uniref:hypothetical protein n=1 Tax=Actinoplanes sp. NPDC048967 TaxID=3155269 RepID=UPI00340E4E9F
MLDWDAVGSAAQVASLTYQVAEDRQWFRPTRVRMAQISGGSMFRGGSASGFDLLLGMTARYDRRHPPSVYIIATGAAYGVSGDGAWVAWVRLGGSYRFLIPPGRYDIAALYIAERTQRHKSPPLLAVGEYDNCEIVHGDRRKLPMQGVEPTEYHYRGLRNRPGTESLFRIPSDRLPMAALGEAYHAARSLHRSIDPPAPTPRRHSLWPHDPDAIDFV